MIADFSNLVVNEVEIETSHDTSESNETKCKTKIAAPFFEPADYLNGALFEELNYCWSQSFTEIEIHIRLPEEITSKNTKVNITSTSIEVYSNLNGERKEILSGQLSEKCKAPDAMWTITGSNKLNIAIDKIKEIWWKKLLQHEPNIDLTKLDCSRPFDDLAEDTQTQINQIQHDELQKLKGELTSEQIKQRDLLQKAWDVDGSPFKGQPFDPNIVQFQN